MRHFIPPLIVVLISANVAVVILFALFLTVWPGTFPATATDIAVSGTYPPGTSPVVPTQSVTGSPKTPTTVASPAAAKTITSSKPVPEIVVTIITSGTPPFPVPPGPVQGDPYTLTPSTIAGMVHELVNQQRAAAGLPALAADTAIAAIAEKHSADMAANNFFDHVNPAGLNPTARGAAAGYSCRKEYRFYYTYGIAENIFQNNRYSAVSYYSNGTYEYDWLSPGQIAETTVGGWMNSSGHRENILTPTFDREGIGVAIGADDKVYITEDFC